MNYRQIVGQRIRNLRLKNGLTQEGLSELADVDYRSIGAIERGERNVTLDALAKIAESLNVTVGELFSSDAENLTATFPQFAELVELMESMTDSEREEAICLLYSLKKMMPTLRQMPASGRRVFAELIQLVLDA